MSSTFGEAFSLWFEVKLVVIEGKTLEKVKSTKDVLYGKKIQLVMVREVAPSLRTRTQELQGTWFRYESNNRHVSRTI